MGSKLLEYQKIDIELNKLKRDNAQQGASKSVDTLSTTIKNCQNKILELEETSKSLLESFKKLMEVYKKGLAYVQKNKNTDISKMSVEELQDYEVKMSQTAKQLSELETRMLNHNQEVKKVVLDYKMYRKKILDAKEAKENLKTDEKPANDDNTSALLAKKAELEKAIEPAKLAKYKSMKQDGIFPVLVPLVDKRCGGCRMELSSVALDKLKNGEPYECEQCRRIIYVKKD